VDGRGEAALFRYPVSIAAAMDGRVAGSSCVVYVADYGNNAVRKILYEEWSFTLGTVTTLVGRSGWGAKPAGLVLSFSGTMLFVADDLDFRVLTVSTTNGTVGSLSGSGVQVCTPLGHTSLHGSTAVSRLSQEAQGPRGIFPWSNSN
jgi:DNA-binding beta-propeller fold protein YncE